MDQMSIIVAQISGCLDRLIEAGYDQAFYELDHDFGELYYSYLEGDATIKDYEEFLRNIKLYVKSVGLE